MGYYGIFLGLEYKNAREMTKRFDEGRYDQGQTEVIKIPFKSKELSSSETFERLDGDFERDGEVYRIIKSRLFRDTFHIVYIKDKTGTAINKALTDYVKTFIEHSPNHGSITVKPFFIKEYVAKPMSMQRSTIGWEQEVRKESHSTIFIGAFTASILHPPERG
jgi:hypothetical protein